MANGQQQVWVFGYGSLCWNPGFEYAASVLGYIDGFNRRFWQGNVTHRGTRAKPGRVATLVQDKNGVVWGRAFLLSRETADSALAYLESREMRLGGYERLEVPVRRAGGEGPPLTATLYTATPLSPHWLGEAPEAEIARQILNTSGPSGHNVEYLLRLADFMREEIPEAYDDHLFRLEALVRGELGRRLSGPWKRPTPAADSITPRFADSLPAANGLHRVGIV